MTADDASGAGSIPAPDSPAPSARTGREAVWTVSRDLYLTAGLDGVCKDANPAWQTELGIEPASMAGGRLGALAHPDEADQVKDMLARLVAGEEVSDEFRVRDASGRYIWYHWTGFRAGDLIYVLGRNAETLKARERELETRTQERDRAWRASRDLYVTISLDGIYREANPAWETQLGLPPAAMPGRSMTELAHPDDHSIVESAFERIVEEGAFLSELEVRVRGTDDFYRPYSWTVFRDGDVVVAIGRNIEQRVRERAALKAAEEAMRQSQKLEAVGQLTGGVAHDFNNLMMAVRANLSALERRLGDPGAREECRAMIANALESLDRGASLTRHMLAFARKQELDVGAVDVRALLEGMEPLLSDTLGQGLDVRIEVPDGLPAAWADANQLELAVLNLALNARDAMEGSGVLHVSAAGLAAPDDCPGEKLEPGAYVALSVADTGCGMDADTLERALDPFFTTKEVGKGTGLGLSMVHGLARQSGGAFSIESTPGEGTTARILVPAASEDAAAASDAAGSQSNEEPQAELPAEDAPAEAPEDAAMTVLAVDDDVMVLMGTAIMLEDLGHTVIQASGGAEALEHLAAHPEIGLLLTDQAMPKMTGMQLAEAARKLRPELPVVLATGFSKTEDSAEVRLDARLGKPFNDRELEAALERAMGSGPG